MLLDISNVLNRFQCSVNSLKYIQIHNLEMLEIIELKFIFLFDSKYTLFLICIYLCVIFFYNKNKFDKWRAENYSDISHVEIILRNIIYVQINI